MFFNFSKLFVIASLLFSTSDAVAAKGDPFALKEDSTTSPPQLKPANEVLRQSYYTKAQEAHQWLADNGIRFKLGYPHQSKFYQESRRIGQINIFSSHKTMAQVLKDFVEGESNGEIIVDCASFVQIMIQLIDQNADYIPQDLRNIINPQGKSFLNISHGLIAAHPVFRYICHGSKSVREKVLVGSLSLSKGDWVLDFGNDFVYKMTSDKGPQFMTRGEEIARIAEGCVNDMLNKPELFPHITPFLVQSFMGRSDTFSNPANWIIAESLEMAPDTPVNDPVLKLLIDAIQR